MEMSERWSSDDHGHHQTCLFLCFYVSRQEKWPPHGYVSGPIVVSFSCAQFHVGQTFKSVPFNIVLKSKSNDNQLGH